jgi:hypothetical protein
VDSWEHQTVPPGQVRDHPDRVALGDQQAAAERLQVAGQGLEGAVQERAPVRAAGTTVQQGPVGHEDGHDLVGGVEGGAQGRVVGHPQVPAEPDDGTAGHAPLSVSWSGCGCVSGPGGLPMGW